MNALHLVRSLEKYRSQRGLERASPAICKNNKMDQKLLNKAEAFARKLKFPMNQGELDMQSHKEFAGKTWSQDEVRLINGLLESITLCNLVEIRQAMEQALHTEIEQLLGQLSADNDRYNLYAIPELAIRLGEIIQSQLEEYIYSLDERLELVNMLEFTEAATKTFMKQAMQRLALHEEIQETASQFNTSIRQHATANGVLWACVDMEPIQTIADDFSAVLDAQLEDLSWVRKLEAEAFSKAIPQVIDDAASELKLQLAKALFDEVAYCYLQLRRREIQPFDEAKCNAVGLTAFLTLVASQFGDKPSGVLPHFIQHHGAMDVLEARRTFLLSTTLTEKVHCSVCLVLTASHLLEIMLDSPVNQELVYSPEVRVHLQAFFQSLSGSDVVLLFPNLLPTIERVLAYSLCTSGIACTNSDPNHDFGDVIKLIEHNLDGAGQRSRAPDSLWGTVIQGVQNAVVHWLQQINPFPNLTSARKLEILPLNPEKSLHMLLCFSGWTSESDDLQEHWSAVKQAHPSLSAYTVRWSSVSLEAATRDLWGCFLLPFNWKTKVFFAGLRGGLIMTSFFSARQRAKHTGKLIADLIAQGFVNYKCGLSLIGFSLGTQVIISCLERLADYHALYIQDVVLMGSAVRATKLGRIVKAKRAVAGRFVNVYCRKDWTLKFCFGTPYGEAVGLGPLNIEGVENYDVTSFVDGHSHYNQKKAQIFEKIGFKS